MSDEQTKAPKANPPPEPPPPRAISDPVKVALISATATILVALISGIFALVNRSMAPAAAPPTATVSATDTPPPRATSVPVATTVPTAAATSGPSDTAAILGTGLAFATQITPDGVAVDPAHTFPVTARMIYAVFAPGKTPPGLQVYHPNPEEGKYYAYLQAAGGIKPTTIGWQWRFQGTLVNEYETPTDSGYLWLAVNSQASQGLFEGVLGGAGVYDVVITLAGNPAIHAQLTAQP